MTIDLQLNRRQFVFAMAAVGGGLAMGCHFEKPASAAAPIPTELNPWLVINPDDSIVIRVTSPEVGNGAATQTALTICEELQCDWSRVRLEYGTLATNDANDKIFTKTSPMFAYFSGRSTETHLTQALLQVGASARERLKLAAAQTWNVPVVEITVQSGVLTHTPSGRTLTYGAVASKAATVQFAVEPALKPKSEWTLLGKRSVAKWHIPQIVTGKTQYGIDVRQPGMLYAALMQSPVQDGQVKSHDFDKIKNMPGVKGVAVIKGGVPVKFAPELASQPYLLSDDRTSAIAVVAEHYWQARKALAALPVEWEDGAGAHWKSTQQVVDTAKHLLDDQNVFVRKDDAEAAAAIAQRKGKLVEATYTTPYCDQAPLEPLNGTAKISADRAELWLPTQITDNARAVAVEETGLAPEQVIVNQTLVGGAFGRRTTCDDVRMVVAVAQQFPGQPVHVIWSREEMFRQGRYRALMAARLQASLNHEGMPQALVAHTVAKGVNARAPYNVPERSMTVMGLLDSPYLTGLIPHTKMVAHDLPIHIRSGAYRGPFYNSNCFFVESFIDECAHAANIDPLDYRLKLFAKYPDPGWSAVLREAAQQAKWGEALPSGSARGIAIGNFGAFGRPQAGSTVCTIATVEVSKAGALNIRQLDVAIDCGSVMNIDAVRAQIEGATIFGLNMALNEKLNIENGRIVEGNFDQYPMLRLRDIPRISIHFGGLTQHERFGEVGEVAAGTVGPAIANAIFKITGKRLRSMPLREHDLRWS